MALKRLDEEFELKPGTQLLPYMKRLLPSLEGRFQAIEAEGATIESTIEDVRAVALARINEILIPATEDIIAVTTLGFMLGPSTSSVRLEIGMKTFIITEGPQRASFTPSPYVIVEREANIVDYAIARVLAYDRENGELILQLTAVHGNPGPWTDWMISSTPGMADSTKLYHDAVGPMHDTVVADAAQVAQDKIEIQAALDALISAGLDVNAFVRRDGTVPFQAVQVGVHPPVGSNDTILATTAWSRARMIEYLGNAVSRSGDTMSGHLNIPLAPTQNSHATSKQYVDSVLGSGGIINGAVTIRASNPALRLQPNATGEYRMLDALSVGSIRRWVLALADNATESGGNAGSNFAVLRYNDTGVHVDTPLSINRQSGTTFTKALNVNGGLVNTGNMDVINGDLSIYRAGSNATGVIFMNAARTAYHHWDSASHVFVGGAMTTNGGNFSSGHINCYSIYTNGHAATVWGLTVHGNETVNGTTITNSIQVNSTGPIINLYDTDWGAMYIHHQSDLIGYLNNGGGWVEYTTNAGHKWIAQYGWLHDYVNGRASAYAWDAANYRYSQLVNNVRFVHAGDIDFGSWWYQTAEIWNACITGLSMATPYYGGPGVFWARWRQCQHNINGGWYTSGWAS
jgi:hypothetical protein